jgi:murein DD-endopeptidase MepM/ murein hydrolase activator NlpD
MKTAQNSATFKLTLIFIYFFAIFVLIPKNYSNAETSEYRSAQTITTDGNPAYTNLSNCNITDGNTCDRAQNTSYANLYFRDFGDFGIPENSIITNVRIRVTGKSYGQLYAGISPGTRYASNCQDLSDIWTIRSFNNVYISAYNVTAPMKNGTLSYCLSLENIKNNNYIWRINYSGPINWSSNIDNFEIAFDYNPPADPTPTPTPAGPKPFLDLPWDYQAKGQKFVDAALSMSSYFDHEYPLLSSGMGESVDVQNAVVSYGNSRRNSDLDYSSHDGYDYSISAEVRIGDPVLAAAAGTAEYINNCTPCGNMIIIDHSNGYQTRYMHLQKDGLVVSMPEQKVYVNSRQQIGKVGATGNVRPQGAAGAHIHFGVFQDKNNDGNFNDNVPDGVTDPFGWQPLDPDPWEVYSFYYNGMQRTGNKSYYLWKNPLGENSSTISSSGGSINSNRYLFIFPLDSVTQNTIIKLIPESITPPSNNLISVGSAMLAVATDLSGNPVTNFLNPFNISIDFSNLDLSRISPSSLSIYSSPDGVIWNKEQTTLDLISQKASATISHFTHFALMGERNDLVAPVTTASLSGQMGGKNWFRSDVGLSFLAQDNLGGSGVDYTLTRQSEGSWDNYLSSIIAISEGHYKYEFYSVDKDGNAEETKTTEFDIDKTLPEANIQFNPETLKIVISATDSRDYINEKYLKHPRNSFIGNMQDKAGNRLEIIGERIVKKDNTSITINSLSYNGSKLFNISPVSLLVTYKNNAKQKTIKELIQTLIIKGKLSLKLVYSAKTNKTSVIINVKGKNKIKETLSGMKLLKLNSEKGNINYSYENEK